MTEVILHVYDVTNSGNDKTNNTIMQINKIFKDGIGFGGIFHSAVQVYGDEEWSFGFCEQGTGVFSCPSTKNPMYTFRESIKLGETSFSIFKVNQILRELSREWPGHSYDLLSKNCNHFCDQFCERLGVPKLPVCSVFHFFTISDHGGNIFSGPFRGFAATMNLQVFITGWVNRFAHAGDAAAEIAGNTAYRLRQAKTEIVTASRVAYRFLSGIATNNAAVVAPESPGNPSNSARGSPRFQGTWFKNLISSGAKPSTSSELEIGDENVPRHQQK
ncbi:hypothetical protein BUALT_Bualt01G0073200 [Buddleja alternifolia]|uniref:PPPDE domain-containing protein n=1 Tax=Buddleja alternifolia TaxID=168488 RepID=A0AAV6YFN6_9LAMI|nr:hypothetical protein BUALT_Bualt01G0073200 [Buddleja alternifolia]